MQLSWTQLFQAYIAEKGPWAGWGSGAAAVREHQQMLSAERLQGKPIRCGKEGDLGAPRGSKDPHFIGGQ